MAKYRVHIGWAGRNSGVFRVGRSKIAPAIDSLGYDRIGYSFTPSYSGVYDDLSGSDRYDALGFTIERGGDDPFVNRMSGRATVRLHDMGDGRYNPKNAASPLYGLVRPMRPCRLQGSVDEITWIDLFHGWLDEGSDDPDIEVQQAQFSFRDLSIWLERAQPVLPAMPGTTVGAVIAAIHDSIGWVNPALRSFAAGTSLDYPGSDGTKSGLALIDELLLIDLGTYFHGRDNVAYYLDRYEMGRRATVGVLEVAAGVIPGVALSTVRNSAAVTRTGGVLQIVKDQASVDEFGESAWGSVDSALIPSDTYAAGLAGEMVRRGKEPTAPTWQFTVSEGPTGYLALILDADLVDRVTISQPVSPGDHHIRKIVHSAEAGTLHKTVWTLSERPANNPFIVGRSKIAPAIDSPGYNRVTF